MDMAHVSSTPELPHATSVGADVLGHRSYDVNGELLICSFFKVMLNPTHLWCD